MIVFARGAAGVGNAADNQRCPRIPERDAVRHPPRIEVQRASAAAARPFGKAAPPIIILQRDRSTPSPALLLNSMCRMVGTQCEKVTPSLAMNWSSVSGA